MGVQRDWSELRARARGAEVPLALSPIAHMMDPSGMTPALAQALAQQIAAGGPGAAQLQALYGAQIARRASRILERGVSLLYRYDRCISHNYNDR